MPVEFELQSDQGTDLLEDEESSPVRGDENELAPVLQRSPDFGEREVVVIDMLQVVEAYDLVERSVPEGQGFLADLHEILFEKGPAGFEVREIEVGADPMAPFPPEKIAQYPLGAAEIQKNVRGGDGDLLFDQIDLFLFFEGFLDDLKLPGREVHGRDYIKKRPD